MSVILQARINGGAAASGAITAAEGDSVQLTTPSRVGWTGTPRWEIVDSPPAFACPAGWSTDPTTGVFYFEHATDDPPAFTITAGHWGKYVLLLRATDAGVVTYSRATGINVLSPNGLEDVGRGERDLFGGARKRWVGPLQALVRTVDGLLTTVAGVPALSNTDPQAVGTAAAGVSTDASRSDHVHAPAADAVSVAADGAFIAPGGRASNLPTVIMFNGQSNAADAPPLTMGWSELTAYLGPDILGFGYAADAFVQVVDGSANARANNGGTGTGAGPGLGAIGTYFARHLADATGQTIRTYAAARSGQPLTYFLPASATMAYFEDGTQHATLNNYNWLKAMVTAGGHMPTLYIFIQGEADGGTDPATYRANLETLFAALDVDYPGITMLIVGTIGNADDRNGVGTHPCTGVRQAQREFVDAHPGRALFLDNRDMRGTAHFRNNHYSAGPGQSFTHAGSKETARRIFGLLRGEPARPRVSTARHPTAVYAFDHYYAHRKSVNGSGVLGSWSDDIATDSLGPEGGTPDYVASADSAGGGSVLRFVPANSDRLVETSIAGGNKWVIYAVVQPTKASIDGTSRCLVQLETAGAPATNRISFFLASSGNSGRPAIGLGGSTFDFNDGGTPPPPFEGGVTHAIEFGYDGDALTAYLKVDGYVVGTRSTGLSNVDTGANALMRVGSFSGIAFFGGDFVALGVKAEPSAFPTAAESLEMAMGSAVEYAMEAPQP